MITLLRKWFGHDDKFFLLLESSALEAHSSVHLLVTLINQADDVPALDDFTQARRKDKEITEQIAEQLCKTFVTPLEREDIEGLSIALYKIPKTVEKFSERYLLCRDRLKKVDFSPQVKIIEQTTEVVLEMVKQLRKRAQLETMKSQNDQLQALENEADRLMLALIKDLYSGHDDPLKVIIILDMYELLEKIIDRCRDAGNVIFQIVLKYS